MGKENNKAPYYHSAYLTSMKSTSCEVPGWMSHKLVSILLGKISIISDMQMIPTAMAESEKGLKNLLMRVKQKSEKVGLKTFNNSDHGNQSHHFMANRK